MTGLRIAIANLVVNGLATPARMVFQEWVRP